MTRNDFALIAMVGSAVLLGGCGSDGGGTSGQTTIRLQDEFDPGLVTGTASTAEVEPTVLGFAAESDDNATHSWETSVGVENLRVEDGLLRGTSNDAFPIVVITRAEGFDSPDTLHSVEITARVSAGANLGVYFDPSPEVNLDMIILSENQAPWSSVTPVLPGDELQTYTIPVALGGNSNYAFAVPRGADTRNILVRPTDVAGAEFDIESIRLIYREEFLASIPSGVSWQGLDNVFKETLITRAPERASFDVTVPSRGWLDLSIGTVTQLPATFRVTAITDGNETVVGQETLTTPDRWQAMPVELTEFSGRRITLALEVSSERDGALGFWGAPAVRSRVDASADGDAPQGVILFVADTLRSDRLSAYGHERQTSPVLDRLASEGALVLDNQSQAIWTKVSVPSILTSLYPRTHGVQGFLDRIPAAATTMAEVYREAGYATLGLSANPFVGSATNLHQGYEEFHDPASLAGEIAATPAKSARAQVDRLLPWLEAHSDVPFFVNIHVTDPHSPYPPYPPYDTYYGTAEDRQAYDEGYRRLEETIEGFLGVGPVGDGPPTTEDFAEAGLDPEPFVRQEYNWYDASIRAMDAELGRIVETLEQLGLREKVLVAFISDHGEEFLEHGGHFHRKIYGENSNVPLVLWAPGRIPAGTVVSNIVQSIDLMPTMLELSGLVLPEEAQGRSFVPLLQPVQLASSGVAYAQETWRDLPVFTEQLRTEDSEDRGFGDGDAYAVVTEGWKLVHHVYRRPDSTQPEWELFDHANDPFDQVNLANENPEVVERLGRLIDDWLEFALAAQLPDDGEAIEGLDPAELQRLCSLGYINC